MAAIGPQLRALRVGAKLTQIELGQRINLSQSQISMIETGASPTTTDVVERWADECGGEVIAARDDGLLDALAELSAEDRARVARIARSMPRVPETAKGSLTLAFESVATGS